MNPNELDADDPNGLANDLDASVTHLAASVDLSSAPDADSPVPGHSVGAEQALQFLRPMLRNWATQEPEAAKQALAVLHLESGALLDKHSEKDPADLA